jgi:hypothetical protein
VLSRWFKKPIWPEITFDEIKRRSRLLVIDDIDFPYQALFTRDGYTIERWPDVLDLPALESGFYDVILLDLQGVGREHSSEQGLGILKHLREVAPAQVIIAYSSADWPLKYQEFFNLADAVLSKTSDYVDFKRKVDELLRQRFALGFYLTRIRNVVGQRIDSAEQLDRAVKASIESRSTLKLHSFLKEHGVEVQVINAALNIVQIAIKLVSIWQGQS